MSMTLLSMGDADKSILPWVIKLFRCKLISLVYVLSKFQTIKEIERNFWGKRLKSNIIKIILDFDGKSNYKLKLYHKVYM